MPVGGGLVPNQQHSMSIGRQQSMTDQGMMPGSQYQHSHSYHIDPILGEASPTLRMGESAYGGAMPPDGMDPKVYAMLKSQANKHDGFGHGPVSTYKPGGGGVNYLNQYKSIVKNKYQDVWQTNEDGSLRYPQAGHVGSRSQLSNNQRTSQFAQNIDNNLFLPGGLTGSNAAESRRQALGLGPDGQGAQQTHLQRYI